MAECKLFTCYLHESLQLTSIQRLWQNVSPLAVSHPSNGSLTGSYDSFYRRYDSPQSSRNNVSYLAQ